MELELSISISRVARPLSPSNIHDFDEVSSQNWAAWCSGAKRRLVMMLMMMMEESGSVDADRRIRR
jgi:hypothetical protein